MFRKVIFLLFTGLLILLFSSCLTCEKKEYEFQFTSDHSGKLTIRYINIFSNSLDSLGEINSDYDELMDMWLYGERIERNYPKATKFKKRLYEQDGVLCGEVVMEFENLADVRLFRYHNQGPIMFNMGAVPDDGESLLKCNGEYGGDLMSVIFWPDDTKNLRFTTTIAKPDTSCVSLLDKWKTESIKKKESRYNLRDNLSRNILDIKAIKIP